MELYVEKDTDQMRSTLGAIGLAHFIQRLLPTGGGYSVRLVDQGSVYTISMPVSLEELEASIKQFGLPQLLPALKKKFSEGDKKVLENDPENLIRFKFVPEGFPRTNVADYEAEQEKVATFIANKATRQEGEVDTRDRDFPVWAHLASYFGKGSVMRTVYPSVIHSWYAHQGDNALALLHLILQHYGTPTQDDEASAEFWKTTIADQLQYKQYELSPMVTAASVVAPTGVQGNSRIAVSQSLNNNPSDAFWLDMYFALVGYMIVGMPYRSGTDVLLYYPLPKDIDVARLKSQMDTYRDDGDVRRLYGQYSMERAKLDSLAYLNYYIQLLGSLPFSNRRARNTMTGLVGYYYRDVGGTQIPFDETTFAPPHWLPLDSEADRDTAVAILREHRDLINKIYGPKYELTSDELMVINAYRQFITRGDSDTWIQFAVQYHSYAFANMGEKFVASLRKELVEETLMSIKDKMDYRPILENSGFQSIANAIRHTTITAQYRETKSQNPTFRVRHGLGRDLMRRAHNAEQFVEDLTNFTYDYSLECARVTNNTGDDRYPIISSQHIAEVIALIAEYGSRVVANLLVAIGYAPNFQKKESN